MVQHVKQRWCLQTQLLNLDKAMHDKDGKLCNQHKKNTHIGIYGRNKHCINYKPLHCFACYNIFSSNSSESAILCAWKHSQNGLSAQFYLKKYILFSLNIEGAIVDHSCTDNHSG